MEGILRITSKGVGYVEIPDLPEDIEIAPNFLNTGLHNDTVSILLHPRISGRRQGGEVEKILLRAKTRFVGVIHENPGPQGKLSCYVEPDDRRVYRDFFIPRNEVKNAKEGEKVLIEMTSWNNPREYPVGRVIQVLGKPGDHNVEIQSIVYDAGFLIDFPEEVMKEARKHEREFAATLKRELSHRRDFRDVTTFTIDPVDAKDFDDAISLRELPGDKFELGVHIADVSFYVTPGSALDAEATRRGTSIYLVDRTIPMLPLELSANICSLKPLEERLAYSAVFTVSQNGVIESEWYGRTVIRSNKRFSYEEAAKVLAEQKGPFARELNQLNEWAKELKKERVKKGSVLFETEEIRVELNDKHEPIKIYKKPHLPTHGLIEEFMLLANKKVAEHVGKPKNARDRARAFVYRIHDEPNREKIMDLSIFVKSLGYDLPHREGKVSAHSLNALLDAIRGKQEAGLIQTAAIRSMAKAIYATKNIGHFGLAFSFYTHFTSPIRRYPDIMVHRLLTSHLAGKSLSEEAARRFDTTARYASEMEQEAAKAERESIKYKQAEYMAKHIGKTFTGVISGIVEWGIYVEEKETKSEGLVKLANMKDDYYVLDPKNYTLIGERTKKKYRLGDTVKIKVLGADPESRTLDYAIL